MPIKKMRYSVAPCSAEMILNTELPQNLLTRLLGRLRWTRQSYVASRHARKRGLDMRFADFARQLGWRMLMRGEAKGHSLLLTPINSVRYFEFPFAYAHIPEVGRVLDVSSPRIFSLYAGANRPSLKIDMINPDADDCAQTRTALAKSQKNSVAVACQGADSLSDVRGVYDCVWSISTVEHISGEYDDMQAMEWLYGALKPGGTLIVTVPVDRQFRVEHRSSDYYGTQSKRGIQGSYFFQRVYDEPTLHSRLVKPLNGDVASIRWFGEKTKGLFEAHERHWAAKGHDCTVHDPRMISDECCEFASWSEMPGAGVCGIAITKPRRGVQL